MADLVLIDSRPGTAIVTLNRPRKYNAMSHALVAELSDVFDHLARDPELRVVVITGADPAFCAGADLAELGRGPRFGPRVLDPILALSVPVVGAVNGAAITGGLELALACDFRIASERARFADTHARIGIVPVWGLTSRLPLAVGQAWARQMSFTGDFVDAQTALRIGLVNEVVAHDALLERAVSLADSIAATAATALARIRGIYDQGRDGTSADVRNAELAASREPLADDAEGFAARRAMARDKGRGPAAGPVTPG